MNSTFQEISTVIEVNLTLLINFFKMQLRARQGDLKSECLFRTCSVATNLVTSPNNEFQIAVLVRFTSSAIYGTVPYSIISFI